MRFRMVVAAALPSLLALSCGTDSIPTTANSESPEKTIEQPTLLTPLTALESLPKRDCALELKEKYIQLLKADGNWNGSYLKFKEAGFNIPTARDAGANRTTVDGKDGGLIGQCTDFIQCAGAAPFDVMSPTSDWIQGGPIMSFTYVPTGTVAATFSNGVFSGHVLSVYGKYPGSISVWDQNFGSPVIRRHPILTSGVGVSDADEYCIVRLGVTFGSANPSWDCIDDATPPNQTVTMSRGATRTFRVSLKDMGTATWSMNGSGPNQVYLAACTSVSESRPPSNRESAFAYGWVGGTRWKAALPKVTVSQNEYAVFDFKMKAPSTKGTYTERFWVYAHADGNGLWIPRTDAASYRVIGISIKVI